MPDRSVVAPDGRPAGADRRATDVTPATGDGVPVEGEQDRRTGPGGLDKGPGPGEPAGVPGSGAVGGASGPGVAGAVIPGPGVTGAVTVPGLRAAHGPDDPALHDVDADFRRLLERFDGMARRARATLRRPLHTHAVTVGGTLVFQDAPGVPRHPFFAPGLRYPVLARFSNGESPDDLIPGTRGLSLLLLHPAAPADPVRSPFNLTLNTGRRLFTPDAATFVRYLLGTDTDRAAVVREVPGAREALWEQIRRPVPLAGHHYHSQAPRLYTDAAGTPWLVRYRVVPDGESGGEPGTPADPSGPGCHDPGDRLFPPVAPEFLPREPGDRRSPRLFRDHLLARAREADGGGVRLLFQIQLHPLGTDPRANQAALDASADWPEAAFPHHTVGRLTLDTVPDDDLAEQAVFDPACAPPGLGIALARSPYETASVNHARALVYRAIHAARAHHPAAPTPALAPAPVPSAELRSGGGPRRVCVIGAGPAGLTAARELEKRGHIVVVLDSADEVGGKSASVEIDGLPYDLGAHLCTSRYGELAGLVAELGLETEDTTPTLLYDTDRAATAPPTPVAGLPEALARYRALRAERFPGISAPGLAPAASALSRPAASWLDDHGLTALGQWLGDACTASGYGYLDGDGDGDGHEIGDVHAEQGPRVGGVPALYFVRHAEMTGLITPGRAATGHLGTFTVKGGFGRLWRRVADELADVRTGVHVTRIERSADGVTVHTGDGTLRADALVLACPLDQATALLEPDARERALAARIRTLPYRTVLCRITGLPENGMYLVRTGGRIAPPGHCVAFHHRHPGSDVYACYAYGPDTPEAEAVLRADIEAMGGRLEEVLLTRTWRFMPHFSAADLAAGILDRLENLQGRDRTYHTGGLHGFELIENVIAHSRTLVERFFGAPGTPETNCGAGMGTGSTSAPVLDSAVPVPGHAEILTWLEGHLAFELGHPREEFDPHAPLTSYGLDSLTSVTLLADLSRRVGMALPPTLLLDLPTLDAVAAYTADLIAPAPRTVTAATAGTGSAAPAVPPEAGATPGGTLAAGATDSRPALPPASPTAVPLTSVAPFFCVGGAVGSAHQLFPLASALGPRYPFYGLQAPGVDGRETPLTTVEALAERYLTAVRAVQPQGPYLLGGYSFGGLVAYEAARLLRGAGHEVTAVVALDTYVPEPGQPVPGRDDRAALLEIAAVHRAMAGDNGGFRPRPELTDAQCRALAHRELAATGTPLADTTLDRLLAVYQASLAAYVRYRVPPSDLRVVLVKAAEEFPPVIGETRRPRLPVSDPTAGWGGVDLGALEVTRLPGGHFTLLRPDHVGAVAGRLRTVLDDRWAAPPAGQAVIPAQRRAAS